MATRSDYVVRAGIAAAIMIACSEGSQPTQPSARTTDRRISDARPSSDVVAADLPLAITACYVPKKGSIYRIKTDDTPSACERGDVEFSWQAARAIAGMEFHGRVITIPSDGRYSVFCPEGQAAINFGWEIPITSTAQSSQIKGVRPALSAGRIGWGIQAAAGTQYVIYWTCAPAEPGVLAPE